MGCRYVYFIRHGESVANKDCLFGLDLPLTEDGIKQSILLRSYFSGISGNIGMVVSSDMTRALKTASNVFMYHNVLVVDRRFREINFGLLEGKPVTGEVLAELQEDPLRICDRYLGDSVWKRADTAIGALRSYIYLSNGDLVVVGHDTLFECMLQRSGYYLAMNGGNRPFVLWDGFFRLPNCGVLRISADWFGKEKS